MSKNKQQKAKAAAMRAIMSNKNLAADIFAGQMAPVGSTKRKKAGSILSNVHKSITPDQLGGKGLGISFGTPAYTPSQPSKPQPVAPPSTQLQIDPNSLWGQQKPTIQVAPSLDSILNIGDSSSKLNEEGGFGEIKKDSGQFTTRGREGTETTTPFGVRQEQTPRLGSGRLSGYLGISPTGEVSQTQPGLTLPGQKPFTPYDPELGKIPEFGELPKSKPEPEKTYEEVPVGVQEEINTYHKANTYYDACMSSSVADLGGKTQHEYCYLGAKEKTGKAPTASVVGRYSPDDMASTAADTSPIDLQDMLEYAIETGDWTDLDEWYNEIKKTNPDMADVVSVPVEATLESLAKGMTMEEFQIAGLLNPKALAEGLGVPLELVESLPFDLFGGEKAEDLQEIARQQFNLNRLEVELIDQKTRLDTSSDRYQNYVRGKDEILGKVDEMLYNYNRDFADIDKSDPYIARRYKNYENYLLGLKGAQTKRYIDVINSSIEQEQVEYDRLAALYETQVDQATNFITTRLEQQKIDQQKAEKLLPFLTSALDSMYMSARGIDVVAEQKEKLEMEKFTNVASLLKTFKDLGLSSIDDETAKKLGISSGLRGVFEDALEESGDFWVGGNNNFTDVAYKGIAFDQTGEDDVVKPLGMNDLYQRGKEYGFENIKVLINRYGDDAAATLRAEIAENGDNGMFDEFMNKLLEEDTIEGLGEVAMDYGWKLINAAEEGMKEYLTENKVSEMKVVVKDILKGKIDSEEQLIKKHGGRIDEKLLSQIWQFDEQIRQEIFEATPERYETIDDVPHLGIDKSEWNTLLNNPEAMASYFLANAE